MARTWFAGPPNSQTAPPSKHTASETADLDQYNKDVLSKNQIAVKDFAGTHQKPATKTIISESESDASVTWATPFPSPQKELNAQPAKETVDATTDLPKKLAQQHSKPEDLRMTATLKSKEPTTFKPVETVDTFVPSPSARCRAPIAQMVPLPSNAAVTTAPTATATPENMTKKIPPLIPFLSAMGTSSSQASFHATASVSLPSTFILPSSPAVLMKEYISKKIAPKTPSIAFAPAPATAPSAFSDAALAAPVQNTRVITSVQHQTNGVQKRQYIKTSSPLKKVSTPESVPEAKRGPGRPRTRPDEQLLQQNLQHRPPIDPRTPLPQPSFPNQPTPYPSAPSTSSSQRPQTVTLKIDRSLQPTRCSEHPRLWPGHSNYVDWLQNLGWQPETIHSEPIQACTNHAAHQTSATPHGRGVCITCRNAALRHFTATRPELLAPAWWPLCKTCRDDQSLHIEPCRKGCSCSKNWLCFSCQTVTLEKRLVRNAVEAEVRRRTFVGKDRVGDVRTVIMGWVCECGREIGPETTLMKCIGCEGMRIGKIDPRLMAAKEQAMTKKALAWT